MLKMLNVTFIEFAIKLCIGILHIGVMGRRFQPIAVELPRKKLHSNRPQDPQRTTATHNLLWV